LLVNAPGIAMVSFPVLAARVLAIAGSLALWFWTQWLLARRPPAAGEEAGVICDGIHRLTARINRRLLDNPLRANALLISSSLVIDLLGLLMLFALRQFCQAFCPLPPPPGMIWRSPGFPAVLVTYGTSNDLFFSGHTAIAVYGAVALATAFGSVGLLLGTLIVLFEMSAVLVLRAHYTMDVFAGAVTALYVHRLAIDWAPTIDGWIAHAVAAVAR
jgi:hypothetical protein